MLFSNKNIWRNFFLLTNSPKSNCSTKFKTPHDEELRHLHRPPRIFRIVKCKRFRYAGRVVQMGKADAKAYKMLVGKIIGKWLLARPRKRWEENIETDHKKVGCENGS